MWGKVYMDRKKTVVYFGEFYESILQEGIQELRKRIHHKIEYLGQEIYSDFSVLLEGQLQNICLRTLIVQMHEWKENVLLDGEDIKKEYEFFCDKVIGKKEFLKKFLTNILFWTDV